MLGLCNPGFCKLADILIVLDEVLCLEISNLAMQLKFKPEINDDHRVVNHVTTSMWFSTKEFTIVGSTRGSAGRNMTEGTWSARRNN